MTAIRIVTVDFERFVLVFYPALQQVAFTDKFFPGSEVYSFGTFTKMLKAERRRRSICVTPKSISLTT